MVIIITLGQNKGRSMTEVKFFNTDYEPDIALTYSVITARFKGRWIFVRHQDRTTWEIAGGHIEPGEGARDAACRELQEETGALKFDLDCIATYSVLQNGRVGYGRLYIAEIYEIGEVPDVSEIAEIVFLERLPDNLTYPDIQPVLFSRSIAYLRERNSD
jgi:8-oxo-dGTP diphosphatase